MKLGFVSAILDGCTYFGVFFKILLPLLKPAIVTSAIVFFLRFRTGFYSIL